MFGCEEGGLALCRLGMFMSVVVLGCLGMCFAVRGGKGDFSDDFLW
jgi:hypothetical protein